jgi:hypothetical protein
MLVVKQSHDLFFTSKGVVSLPTSVDAANASTKSVRG